MRFHHFKSVLSFQVFEYEYVWIKGWPRGQGEKPLEPYLVSCLVPEDHRNKTLTSVSLVEGKCDKVSNNLRVTYKPRQGKGPKHEFGVCVHAFSLPKDDDGRPVTVSKRLIEWIELVFMLGAKKIFFYNHTPILHQNVRKVGLMPTLQQSFTSFKHSRKP